ncbi:MAG: ribosomal protein S18-alanine N-acetyltransferase [Deltaproteobacteria bacterium]|nr:ribosomal protein S18-alanine N-acetyltransferase [Deltaproteobacteria bacterium]
MKGERPKEECEPPAFSVRAMTAAADLEAVQAIESENPSPWTAGQLASELEQEGGWQFVAEVGASGLVCGFICGRSCVGEGELLKIAVALEYRQQGVATQLVEYTLCYLAEQGVDRCFLELRASNLPAFALYERFGFRRVGLRKNYYASPPEDAILMEKTILVDA